MQINLSNNNYSSLSSTINKGSTGSEDINENFELSITDYSDLEIKEIKPMVLKIDVHSATTEEIVNFGKKLYDSGEISLLELGAFELPEKLAKDFGGKAYLTSVTDSGKVDWVKEFQARAAKDLSWGNMEGYARKQHIVKILNKYSNI